MKAFLLLVFVSSSSAMVSGPYTAKECQEQAEMVRSASGKPMGWSWQPGQPRKKGDVECVRDATWEPPSNMIFTPSTNVGK